MWVNGQLHSFNFSILNIEHCRLDNSWNYTGVISPFTRIYLIDKGEALLTINQHKIRLIPGYMYIIPDFTYSCYECPEYMEQYYLHFTNESKEGLNLFNIVRVNNKIKAKAKDYELFKKLLKLNPDKGLLKKHPKHYDNNIELIQKQQLRIVRNIKNHFESTGILMQLISNFLKEYDEETQQNISLSYRFRNTLEYIHNNLNRHITIKELAEDICLNTDYFSRLFFKLMGVRPLEYINKKKIEHAQNQILSSERSFKEIGGSLGFNNYNYFSRTFKAFTGITPQEFRKNFSVTYHYV